MQDLVTHADLHLESHPVKNVLIYLTLSPSNRLFGGDFGKKIMVTAIDDIWSTYYVLHPVMNILVLPSTD